MRIIGGRFKGLGLTAVGKGDASAHLRPTTDRVRESLFNILGGGKFGDPVEGALVLDLFAGTGALGLEALSRGAKHVTFVESGRAALALLGSNIAKAKVQAETSVVRSDATRLQRSEGEPADLVLLDPPYGTALGNKALARAFELGWISHDALIVWEDEQEPAMPDGFERLDARRFGKTWLTFCAVKDISGAA